ncbi:MAG: gamma-glutamyltransferase, partial [Halothiobacillus sp.]|nr:gamma-glutamyltransferase [Halothiobacillus sp.]
IGTVELESGFNKAIGAALEKRGYKVDWVTPGDGAFGGYEAIMYDAKDHVYWGASEMRKDGEVLGY